MELEQLEGLRVVARRDLDVVTPLPNSAMSGRKNSTCGEFEMSTQTRTR